MVGAIVASPAASAAAEPETVVTYSLHRDGDVRADMGQFADVVQTTLDDPRGWSLDGRITYRRVSSDADMRLVLASPASVEDAASGCSAQYSCRVGRRVLVNDKRWRKASDAWSKSVDAYRRYVINHEVGHFLGLDHRECPESGAAAPVMLQQTISNENCRSNVWPRMAELRAAARVQDLPVPSRSPEASPQPRSSGQGENSQEKDAQGGDGRDAKAGAARTVSDRSREAGGSDTPVAPSSGGESSGWELPGGLRPVLPETLLALVVAAGCVGALRRSSTKRRRRRGDRARRARPSRPRRPPATAGGRSRAGRGSRTLR